MNAVLQVHPLGGGTLLFDESEEGRPLTLVDTCGFPSGATMQRYRTIPTR